MMIFTDGELQAAYQLSAKKIRQCQLACAEPHPWELGLYTKLDQWTLSKSGHPSFVVIGSACRISDYGTTVSAALLSARQLADRLGLSPKHLKRHPELYGGFQVDGRWLFPAPPENHETQSEAS